MRVYDAPLTTNSTIGMVGNPLTKLRKRLIVVKKGDGITIQLSVLNYTRISVPVKCIREVGFWLSHVHF